MPKGDVWDDLRAELREQFAHLYVSEEPTQIDGEEF